MRKPSYKEEMRDNIVYVVVLAILLFSILVFVPPDHGLVTSSVEGGTNPASGYVVVIFSDHPAAPNQPHYASGYAVVNFVPRGG